MQNLVQIGNNITTLNDAVEDLVVNEKDIIPFLSLKFEKSQ